MSTPTHIGPYRVVRAIAQGGLSAVYEVADPETGSSLAAKVLLQKDAGLTRFEREYRALTRIDHPNVVSVYRYGETDEGQPYLIMELLQGVPAQVRVKSIGRPGEPARTAESARIALHVAEALAHLHSRDIVHRDLKSNNVIVLGDGTVKVLDFGTALLLRSREQITGVGEFVGTFAYASPEQITGGAVDARSDLYALGVLFYRMLTAKRPFEADSPHALARLHLHVIPRPPNHLVPALPDDLSALAMQLLAKDPGDRPPSAIDLVRRLNNWAGRDAPFAPPNLRFIGRQQQLGALQTVFATLRSGGVLLFSGAEGCGRGRLVDLALEDAQTRGFRCFPLDMASGGLRALGFALLDTVGELDPPEMEASARIAALEPNIDNVAAALATRAAVDPFPIVLGARGLHRATRIERDALGSVLVQLAEREAKVLLVGTASDGESVAGARVVDVPPLTGAEVAALASQWLGVASVPPELVRRLLVASGGMPTPLEEIVRALPRDGADSVLVVPGTVRDALLIRIDSLGRAERRVAEVVALGEGDFDLDNIVYAVDESPEDVTAALTTMERDRLVLRKGVGWAFRIGIAAELVRTHMRATRRHVVVRRLAERSAGLPATRAIAELLLAADRPTEAAHVAATWAESLLRSGLHADALPILAAVTRGRPNAPGRAWRMYAECLAEVRPHDDGVAQAVANAGALADGEIQRGEVELVAARLARARGDTDAERALLHAAVTRFRDDGRRLSGARERLADACYRVGDLAEARRHARDAVAAFPGDAAHAEVTLALVLVERGALIESEQYARRAIAAFEAQGKTAWRAAACLAASLRWQGRWSEALSALEECLTGARSEAPARRLATILFTLADLDLDLFRIGQARDRVAQALDVLDGEIPPRLDATHALLKARLLSETDDYSQALTIVEAAVARTTSRGMFRHAAQLRAVRAVVMRHVGRGDIASAEFAAARNALRTMGATRALGWVAALRARSGHGEEPADDVFSDVREWMTTEPARMTRVEYRLAALRSARRQAKGLAEAHDAARLAVADLRAWLSAEDAAALAVHPWTRTLGDT